MYDLRRGDSGHVRTRARVATRSGRTVPPKPFAHHGKGHCSILTSVASVMDALYVIIIPCYVAWRLIRYLIYIQVLIGAKLSLSVQVSFISEEELRFKFTFVLHELFRETISKNSEAKLACIRWCGRLVLSFKLRPLSIELWLCALHYPASN